MGWIGPPTWWGPWSSKPTAYEPHEPRARDGEAYPPEPSRASAPHIQAHYPHEDEDQRQDQELARVQPGEAKEETLLVLLGWPVRLALVKPYQHPEDTCPHASRPAQAD
jgi:hypothetical protein